MKTINNIVVGLLLSLTLTNTTIAQELLDDITIIITSPKVITDDFSTFNSHINSLNPKNFRDILKTTTVDRTLVFLTTSTEYKINERHYVNVLRRSVNNSDSFSEFIINLQQRFPKLRKQITGDSSLRDLYFTTRKNTFNGYVANLPSIL